MINHEFKIPDGVTAPVTITWADGGEAEKLRFEASGLIYKHADGALEPRNAWAITQN